MASLKVESPTRVEILTMRGRMAGAALTCLLAWLAGGCSATPSPITRESPQTRSTPAVPESSPGAAPDTKENLRLAHRAGGVLVESPWPGAEVFRSHKAFGRQVRLQLDAEKTSLRDSPVPDGITLHYVAVSPSTGRYVASRIDTPGVQLARAERPRLVVDKLHYTLSVLDGDTVLKTYPVGLGSDASKRKICQDNMTTPEGLYTIYNLQPEATFFKAYDINYPNEVDQLRYQIGKETGLVPPDREIGGEIQIHGRGSLGNWTFGCISLDDTDIAEMFEHPELGLGMELFICGSEIRPEDRPWLLRPPPEQVEAVQQALRQSGHYSGAVDGVLGGGTQEALGRYQTANGLPLTCQLDFATRAHFGIEATR